jgi:UDP-N-acetylmuramate dehydrogenase
VVTASSTTKIARSLTRVEGVAVRENEPLSRHTSFGIGGPADLFVIPRHAEALRQVIRISTDEGIEPVVLGNGTNLIVRDQGIRGVVVRIAGPLNHVRTEETLAVAEAGATLASICFLCAQNGLAGLEFAAGIPGTLGGGLIMNAGANGGEMGDVTEWVEIARPDGSLVRLDGSALDFAYRHSSLKANDGAIVRAGLRLEPGNRTEIHRRLCDVIALRCAKQPVSLPSAGCIFKRPDDDYAGRLLEEAGAKGMRVGGAAVSRKHANFVVNLGGATAADVLKLIEAARERVYEKFGVTLEPEVCIVGEGPDQDAA